MKHFQLTCSVIKKKGNSAENSTLQRKLNDNTLTGASSKMIRRSIQFHYYKFYYELSKLFLMYNFIFFEEFNNI